MSANQPSSFPELPTFEAVQEQLQPLLNLIQQALAEGTLHVSEYSNWQVEPIDYALAPNLVRHKAKAILIAHGQDANDEVEENVGFETDQIPNNGICILTPGFTIRALKSSDDGSIPLPGNSVTRQNFYKQFQALLDFEELRNGNEHVQPIWGLVVHWTVDANYTLLSVSVALPLRFAKSVDGKLTVECAFDEPFWRRPPQSNVITLSDTPPQPSDLDIEGIQMHAEEKTGEEPQGQ